MVTPAVVLLLLAGEVDLQLIDDGTCTTTVAVFEATDPKVPGPVPLRMVVRLRTAERVDVRIDLDTAGTSTKTRDVQIERVDCPLLPRLIASIAERYVTALPERNWAAFRRQRKLTVYRPRETPSGPPVVTPWNTRLGIEVGGGIGLDRPTPIGRITGRFEIGPVHRLRGVLTVGAGLVANQPIGAGSIDVWSLSAGVGPSYAIALDTITIIPEVRISSGAHFGRGRDFESASSNTILLLDTFAGVTFRADDFGVVIGADLSLVRARFTRVDGEAYEEPLLRIVVAAGWSTVAAQW